MFCFFLIVKTIGENLAMKTTGEIMVAETGNLEVVSIVEAKTTIGLTEMVASKAAEKVVFNAMKKDPAEIKAIGVVKMAVSKVTIVMVVSKVRQTVVSTIRTITVTLMIGPVVRNKVAAIILTGLAVKVAIRILIGQVTVPKVVAVVIAQAFKIAGILVLAVDLKGEYICGKSFFSGDYLQY